MQRLDEMQRGASVICFLRGSVPPRRLSQFGGIVRGKKDPAVAGSEVVISWGDVCLSAPALDRFCLFGLPGSPACFFLTRTKLLNPAGAGAADPLRGRLDAF